MLVQNYSPVLAKTEVNYKYPLRINDKPIGKAWVEEFARAKWLLGIEIVVNKKIYCTGRQLGYMVDLTRLKPVPIPSELFK